VEFAERPNYLEEPLRVPRLRQPGFVVPLWGEGTETMEELVVIDCDGTEQTITATQHSDWDQLGDPCPECGATEYRHFRARGGQYGQTSETVVERTDYWDSQQSLLTQCLSCRSILQKHPAFDLLYDQSDLHQQ